MHSRSSKSTPSSKARKPSSTRCGPSWASTTTKARSRRPTRRSSPSSSSPASSQPHSQSVLGGIRIDDMSMMFESDSVPRLAFFSPDRPDLHSHLPRHRLLLLPAALLSARRPRGRPSRLGSLSPPRAAATHVGRRRARPPPARTTPLRLTRRTASAPPRCTTSPSAASATCPAWLRPPPRWYWQAKLAI